MTTQRGQNLPPVPPSYVLVSSVCLTCLKGIAAVNRFDRERLADNIAQAIFDIFHTTPRSTDRQHRLVVKQVDRAIFMGWKNRNGAIDNE
jgi:hypothetical protein